jgi:hypothetical protein
VLDDEERDGDREPRADEDPGCDEQSSQGARSLARAGAACPR